MTNVGPDGIPLDTKVDELAFANSIGSLLKAMVRGTGGTTDVGPMGDITPMHISNYSPVTNTPATTTTTTTTEGMAGGTYTSSGADSVSPVPEGTGVAGAYGEMRGTHRHEGVDLSVPVGTTVVAATTGKVIAADNADSGGYGNMIEIRSPAGIISRYAHLSHIGTTVGATVKAGQPIGKSGGQAGAPGAGNSQGPHLHFEIRNDSGSIDPMAYLAGGAKIIVPGAGPVISTQDKTGDATATSAPPSVQDVADTGVGRLLGALVGEPIGSELGAQQTTTNGTQAANGQGTTGTNMTGEDADPAAVDAFLNATKQHESGGNYTIYNQSGQSNASGAYQFIGTTWRGMGGSTANAAEASPAEQDAIAKKMALQLFNQFHSWRLVAIAWYGGPAVAEQVAAGQNPGSPEGQGPYLAYGDTIVRMMSGG